MIATLRVVWVILATGCTLATIPMVKAAEPRAAVFASAASDWGDAVRQAMIERLRQRGCAVQSWGDAELSDAARLNPAALDLLVVCDARHAPAPALAPLANYARAGKLLVLGGPYFEHVSWPYAGKFLGRDELLTRAAADGRSKLLFDFESPELSGWLHSSSEPKSASRARRVAEGAEGSQGSMLLELAEVRNWETFVASDLAQPFPAGHAWTTFWAKGDAAGAPVQLVVEWQERDFSRWIAVVKLTAQWQRYVLPPEAFLYWPDHRARGRGASGDRFKPDQALTLSVGMAHSHADAVSPDKHYRIWIDRIGTLAPPPDLARLPGLFAPQALPVIETVSPPYKLYPITNLGKVQVNPGQTIAPRASLGTIERTYAPHARPSGAGFGKKRHWRYEPLIECLDAKGRRAGAAASLVLLGAGSSQGGIVASVPVANPSFFATAATQDWLAEVAGRMLQGVFLYEGGARYYASFGGETIPVGATAVNRGRQPASVVVQAAARDPHQRAVWEKSWKIELPPGEARSVEASWEIPADAPDPMTVTVALSRSDGTVIDRLQHQVRIQRPSAAPQFVRAQEGQFYLGDSPWYVHGVNYMPSSGPGAEDFRYFDNWMGAQSYDPDVIERDLARLKEIGLNAVSAFLEHSALEERNLIDFMVRCRAHGLKVNLNMRPGYPMDFQWEKMREIVTACRLAENDTIMAYDLAWEPLWGTRDRRRTYDPLWRKWIAWRYGSVDAAQRAWSFTAPRENGELAGPSDEQVSKDGPWRTMVLDYRRCLDQLLDSRYRRARDLMRSVDPNHLVSFRMSMAGDPTRNPADMTYDLAGLAGAVDLMEPEAYGRVGDAAAVRPGWFTVAYARAVAPKLPVLWAEFGYSVWSQAEGAPTAERLAFAERFYDDFYQMAHRSGSNGTFCWFSSGGYRVDEKSDYGILDPDGAWRPHTHVIHRWAKQMTAPRALPQPDVVIPIRLYDNVDGIAGIYRGAEKAFWQAVEAGKIPALRLAPQSEKPPANQRSVRGEQP